VHQYSEICDSIFPPLPCGNPVCLSAISVSVFTWIFFQYDSKKDLACMGDKSMRCSVICTLFQITYLGKWDECGKRFLPLTTHHTQFPRSPHMFCALCPVPSLLLLCTVLLRPRPNLWLCDLLFDGWHEHTETSAWWRRGVVVSCVRRMNEVNARRARLVPGWVTVFGRVYHLGM